MTDSKTIPAEPRLSPDKRFILLASRLWAWAFLGLMIAFFIIVVPLSGGATFLTLRNAMNILVAITPVLLLGLGLAGFHHVFGGNGRYLTAGFGGIVVGLLLSLACARYRLGLLSTATAGLGAYLLFGSQDRPF